MGARIEADPPRILAGGRGFLEATPARTPDAGASRLQQQARALVERAVDEPLDVRMAAQRVLDEAEQVGDVDAAVVALRAAGLAALHDDDLPEAMRLLDDAVAKAGDRIPSRRAQVQFTRALVHAYAGRLNSALSEIDEAIATLTPAQVSGEGPPDSEYALDAVRAGVQRGLILARMGQADAALRQFAEALPRLREAGDTDWEERLLLNRGNVLAYRGDLAAADRDFAAAELISARSGFRLRLAKARHNRGFVAARQGDIPAALRFYTDARGDLDQLGASAAIADLDASEALLLAGLAEEAAERARAAVQALITADMRTDAAEAQLLHAAAALEAGNPAEAGDAARAAHAAFVDQARPSWAAVARHHILRADFAANQAVAARPGATTPGTLGASQPATALTVDAAVAVADDLAAAGWSAEAAEARVIAARLALSAGEPDTAGRILGALEGDDRTAPVRVRVARTHAQALQALADEDTVAARESLRAGLRMVDDHRATLGATELRTHASRFGRDLADLGLELALRDNAPSDVLAWVERWRAGALRQAPVRPPQDADMAEHLMELRRVGRQIEQALLEGRPDDVLRRRLIDLEDEICTRSRLAAGAASDATDIDVDAVALALGDTAMVVIYHHRESFGAVAVAERRVTNRYLCPAGVVHEAVGDLRFGLRRLVDPARSASARRAAAQSVRQSAERLDALLIEPIRRAIGDRPVVIAPSGSLHALPWALLPTLDERVITVTPSARMWMAAVGRPVRRSPTVVVAGPDLEHARVETTAVAGSYSDARLLQGGDATAAATLHALRGAGLAHLAAHGRFRSDNPLFSSLRLADGPVWVYDLEALDTPPHTILLSACETGRMSVHPGDELMGLAGSLLAMGTSSVVASVIDVPDELTATLMTDVHRQMAAGRSVSEALAAARSAARARGDEALAAASAFMCFGTGQ